MFDNYPIEQITIFDLSGIKVENVIPEHNEYDISMLPSGMYIVEVTIDGRKTREKLLVQ